jgi:hypothetical protein
LIPAIQKYSYYGQGFYDRIALDGAFETSVVKNSSMLATLHNVCVEGLSVVRYTVDLEPNHYHLSFPFHKALINLHYGQTTTDRLVETLTANRVALTNTVNHYTFNEFVADSLNLEAYDDALTSVDCTQRAETSTFDLFSSWWEYVSGTLKAKPFMFGVPEFLSIGQDLTKHKMRELGYKSSATAIPVHVAQFVTSRFQDLSKTSNAHASIFEQLKTLTFWKSAIPYPRSAAQSRLHNFTKGIHPPTTAVLSEILMLSGRMIPDQLIWACDFYGLIDRIKDPASSPCAFLLALTPCYSVLLVKPVTGDLNYDAFIVQNHTGDYLHMGHLADHRYLQWDLDLLTMLERDFDIHTPNTDYASLP